MRRSTFALLIIGFFSFSSLSTAQTRLGVYAGPNFSDVAVESGIEHDGAIVPTAGFLAEMTVAENLTLSLQPAWLVKASVAKNVLLYDEVTVQAHYASIPLMLTYAFDAGALRPYVTAGASLDFMLGAEMKRNSKWYELDDVESNDVTLNIGAGASYALGENALFIEVRYLHGLQNLYKQKDALLWIDPSSSFEPMSRSVLIIAGYKFSL